MLSTLSRSSKLQRSLCFRRLLSDWNYEKKTPLEHVLLRPGMYIGQTEWTSTEQWVFNSETNKMEKKEVLLSPALLKIFDEIVVNAADNYQRDPTMSKIDINVNLSKDNKLNISILNNGKGIPVEMHTEEKVYIPELIFGHLLTGSNFNDKISRFTGGSHGYGAKLTNIFSNKFEIEVMDGNSGKLYKQQWSDNMSICHPPSITTKRKKNEESYTKVSFEPDLKTFGDSEKLQDHVQSLVQMLQRRVVDIAGCLGPVKVTYNSQEIPLTSFQDYVELYNKNLTKSDDEEKAKSVGYLTVNDHWQIALIPSPDKSFESISFVNNVWTPRGGSHIQVILNQIIKQIESMLKKQGMTTSTSLIKNQLMLFVHCKIENPSFDGQTKDALLTKLQDFGSDATLTSKQLQSLIDESTVMPRIIEEIKLQERSKLILASSIKSSKKGILDVPKLEDAHLAGSEQALDCTLILTEGDSAKALAVAGMTEVGREYYGVMPLRGKVLNVRVSNREQIMKNIELMNLCKAIGLDFRRKYNNSDLTGLRYGKILLMCDQDHDGSHIKGLIINFFHYFWPHLLSMKGFLQEFITPIVKVKHMKTKEMISFYNMYEYEQWKDTMKDTLASYQIKYYKGLGTNTSEEGKSYFVDIDKHRKYFISSSSSTDSTTSNTTTATTENTTEDAIDLVFNKLRVSDRKEWLTTVYSPTIYLQNMMEINQEIQYKDFINQELIHFSFSDNIRSIPHSIDGFKPSQRKVLYGSFLKNLINKEMKVVQLAGYIAEQTAYHHGEVALHHTIIHMAQDYVGSNNIPLLQGIGQFGTRSKGGLDFASPRYIFTKLSPLARYIFPKEDDALLHYAEEDGQMVEPCYFIPIIPMLLINGSTGIGTGWSTNIPTYHILDVIQSIEEKLLHKKVSSSSKPLVPYIQGFRGKVYVDPHDSSQYITEGSIISINRTTYEINELPYGKWTEDYKEYLYKLLEKNEIKSFREYHSTTNVRFVVTVPMKYAANIVSQEELLTLFRLTSTISLNNMHAFNITSTQIEKYSTPQAIIDAYYPIRYEAYQLRKSNLEREYTRKEWIARQKTKFIQDVLQETIPFTVRNKNKNNSTTTLSETDLTTLLQKLGYHTMEEILQQTSTSSILPPQTTLTTTTVEEVEAEEEEISSNSNSSSSSNNSKGYEYLLSMPMSSLTTNKSKQLQAKAEECLKQLEYIRTVQPEDMWLSDLSALREKYREYYEVVDEDKSSIEQVKSKGEEEGDDSKAAVIVQKKRRTTTKKKVTKSE